MTRDPFAYVGEVFTMTVDAHRDVDGHTGAKLFFKKPSGVTVEKTAAHNDGSLFDISIGAEDFDEVGEWSAQLLVEFAAGPRRGYVTSFQVGEGLNVPAE